MKDGPLGFPVVPQKDGLFARQLEVGPFPSDFVLPSVPVLFWRADEYRRCSREVVDLRKIIL